jgi:uncharacterized protein (DUF111 family)
MRAIYLDCFAGISGNMFLGALLQAGVPVAVLEKELAKLPLQDEFQLEVSSVVKNGIHAEFVEVKLRQAQPGHHQEHHQASIKNYDHGGMEAKETMIVEIYSSPEAIMTVTPENYFIRTDTGK